MLNLKGKMANYSWSAQKFIVHEEAEETYPSHYLKCEKLIDGVWTTTGWAKHEQAFRRHASVIGGTVRCGYITVTTEDTSVETYGSDECSES